LVGGGKRAFGANYRDGSHNEVIPATALKGNELLNVDFNDRNSSGQLMAV